MHQSAHRLEERPEHLAALGAQVAHHLQLLVDDNEELVDLLLVGQEVEEPVLQVARAVPAVGVHGGDAEGAADRVHPHVAAVHGDVPLGTGADEVALAGEEQEGPVGAALALQQLAEDREGLVGTPVGDGGAVVLADDQVGALTLADLVGDDRLDELGVLVVVGLEAAPIGQLHTGVVDGLHHGRDGELALGLDVDHDQRRAVVVGLEVALGDLAERDRQQPVGDMTGLRRPVLERDVEYGLDYAAPTTDQPDGVAAARPGRAPDDRPGVVLAQRRDRLAGVARRRLHGPPHGPLYRPDVAPLLGHAPTLRPPTRCCLTVPTDGRCFTSYDAHRSLLTSCVADPSLTSQRAMRAKWGVVPLSDMLTEAALQPGVRPSAEGGLIPGVSVRRSGVVGTRWETETVGTALRECRRRADPTTRGGAPSTSTAKP